MTLDDWKIIHSSVRDDWRTPRWLFERLDREFRFTLDAAASPHNALCHNYLMDPAGLVADWSRTPSGDPQAVFVNPPYGRGVGKWVEKAIQEQAKGATVVMLMSSCTDTLWWRRAWDFANEIRLITGRVKFLNDKREEVKNGAPKGSAILVFRPYGGASYHGKRVPMCTLMAHPTHAERNREVGNA